MKYIFVIESGRGDMRRGGKADEPLHVHSDERPTQEWVKHFGEGSYVLRYGDDGRVAKRFHVLLNRNGNLKVVAETPTGLEGISTLNLNRMVRDYQRIVKLWPTSASAKDYKKVLAEIQGRDFVLSQPEYAVRADEEVELRWAV